MFINFFYLILIIIAKIFRHENIFFVESQNHCQNSDFELFKYFFFFWILKIFIKILILRLQSIYNINFKCKLIIQVQNKLF